MEGGLKMYFPGGVPLPGMEMQQSRNYGKNIKVSYEKYRVLVDELKKLFLESWKSVFSFSHI